MKPRPLPLLFLLLLALTAAAREYDAESDIGLRAENPAPIVARINTTRLTAALEAQWSGGQFTFADGHTGPVLDPIHCSGKEFFFAGTIKTSNKIGGALYGFGSRSYLLPSGGYAGGSGGAVTRFTRIDGDKGGSILRLRGYGFDVAGIEFRGQPYNGDPTGEGPNGDASQPKGTRTPIGIEVEGRTGSPSTGRHSIHNCTFAFCQYGICAKGGYYDDAGKFCEHENHADMGSVSGCLFVGCDSCFRSENEQAVGWNFWDNEVSGFGGKGYTPCTVFDLVKGGDLRCRDLALDYPAVTLFKVNHYSQNSARLECYGLKWDRGTGTANDSAGKPYYLTLFDYDGPPVQPWMKWAVRITGNISNGDNPYHSELLMQVPAAFDTSDFRVDVTNLPAIAGVP